MKYEQVAQTTWVSTTIGYFPAVRLSPSGSGKPYKGKEERRGYLIVELNEKGEGVIDQDNIFLPMDEVIPIVNERVMVASVLADHERDKKIQNLPYKNILDLQPLIYEEIERASKLYGFKTTDDLLVEVTLDNMELTVRIGPE